MDQDVHTKAPRPKKKSFSRGPVGLFIGLLIIAFCSYTIGPDKIIQSLITIRPLYLLGGFILIFCWLLLGVTNIMLMLRPLTKIRFNRVFNAYSNANTAALVVPGQIGDAVIIHFFRNLSIPISQGTTIFAIDKLITLLWYSIIAAYGIYLARFPFDIQSLTEINTSLLLLTMAISILLFFFVLYFSISFLSERVRNWISLSFSYLKQARQAILINILLTFVRTLVLGCAYWLVINAYGSEPSMIHALCFSIAAGMVAYIPISFNGLGTVEASLVYLFSTIDIESAPILSAALTMRVITILVVSGSATVSNLFQRL